MLLAGRMTGAVTALAAVLWAAQFATAAELRVLCIPGMKASVDALLPEFEKTSGDTVSVTYEIFPGQKKRIDSGEFDVAIFAKSQIEQLGRDGIIAATSIADIASTHIGIAVKSGAPHPDLHDEEAFKKLMLSARSIAYTENSSTGVYVTKLLARLGLTDQIKAKLQLQSGGAMTALAVAKGEAEIAIVLVSDIMATPGVELGGLLPPMLQNEVMQSAGLNAKSASLSGQKFISFLRTPTGKQAFSSRGLQPANQ